MSSDFYWFASDDITIIFITKTEIDTNKILGRWLKCKNQPFFLCILRFGDYFEFQIVCVNVHNFIILQLCIVFYAHMVYNIGR